MAERTVCPHCSFRNFSVSRYCARCEKPLLGAAPPPAKPAGGPTPAQKKATTRALGILQRTTASQVAGWPPADAPRPPAAPAATPTSRLAPFSRTTAPAPKPAPPRAPVSPPAVQTPDAHEERTRLGVPLPVFAPAAAAALPTAPLQPAGATRHALACVLDALVWLVASGVWATFESVWRHQSGPALVDSVDPLASLAVWLHTHAHTLHRTLAFGVVFAFAYHVWGWRRGGSLGQRALQLALVGQSGETLTKGAAWPAIAWHIVGSVLSLLTLGAGHFWLIVDQRHRTWAHVLGRTLVVQKPPRSEHPKRVRGS